MKDGNGVGVIVGRFQVANLTEGHKEIFEHVLSKGHNQNLVVLGVAPFSATRNNPLDFDSRRRMIEDTYPGKFTVLYIKDCCSDVEWSATLDNLISDIAGRRPVILYGSRDSFTKHYSGKYSCEAYQQRLYCSGSQEREEFGKVVSSAPAWRAGCVYATQNREPIVHAAMTVVLVDEDDYVYLFKRDDEWSLSFVTSMVQADQATAGEMAMDMTITLAGIEVEVVAYAGLVWLTDWRFRAEDDRVLSTVVVVRKLFGVISPGKDVGSVERVHLDAVDETALDDTSRYVLKLIKKAKYNNARSLPELRATAENERTAYDASHAEITKRKGTKQ